MKNKKINFGFIILFSIFFGFIPILQSNVDANELYRKNSGIFEEFTFEDLIKNTSEKTYVIPLGEAVGVKLYADGLLVIHTSEVVDGNNNIHSPAKDAGIRSSDRIISADGIKIATNEELSDYINKVKRSVELEIARDEKLIKTFVSPVLSNDGSYKIGLWVRDSAAGIGTLTYYNPKDKSFASLGHAITDCDVGTVLQTSGGELVGCEIVSVKKGQNGNPGGLSGQLDNKSLGKVLKNNEFGIFGKLDENSFIKGTPIETAQRYQIKEGKAKILCDVDKNGVKSYDAEILSVSKEDKVDNKGIVLRITDSELLSKTGGIVQGMSGSPIIQNNRLVGAVTHVFVNDPTRGYGIFIENMIGQN